MPASGSGAATRVYPGDKRRSRVEEKRREKRQPSPTGGELDRSARVRQGTWSPCVAWSGCCWRKSTDWAGLGARQGPMHCVLVLARLYGCTARPLNNRHTNPLGTLEGKAIVLIIFSVCHPRRRSALASHSDLHIDASNYVRPRHADHHPPPITLTQCATRIQHAWMFIFLGYVVKQCTAHIHMPVNIIRIMAPGFRGAGVKAT